MNFASIFYRFSQSIESIDIQLLHLQNRIKSAVTLVCIGNTHCKQYNKLLTHSPAVKVSATYSFVWPM